MPLHEDLQQLHQRLEQDAYIRGVHLQHAHASSLEGANKHHSPRQKMLKLKEDFAVHCASYLLRRAIALTMETGPTTLEQVYFRTRNLLSHKRAFAGAETLSRERAEHFQTLYTVPAQHIISVARTILKVYLNDEPISDAVADDAIGS